MSLDLWLQCPTCHRSGDSLNITHNVRPICVEAGCDPWEWSGRTPEETRDELDRAILAIASDPERFAPLAPSNGWGSVAGTLRWLREVRRLYEHAQPGDTWGVCR